MSSATFNGLRVTSARANIPAWGLWYAEVQVDGEHNLTGAATLQIADLILKGTILSGGAQKGRSSFRIVAGAGGWGRTIPKKSYANDAGTKKIKVIADAAAEVGETLVSTSSDRVGTNFVRAEGPASRVLELVADRAWYVDEAGVTRLGTRAAGALVGKVTRITPVDKSRGKVVLAAESIATILPGLVVDGLTAVDVMHEVSVSSGLRSTVWGAQAPSPLDAFAAMIRQLLPQLPYLGVTEYRVDTRNGSRLNLQPVRVSLGMPELKNVPVRPGVAGCEAEVALGSRVLVGFVDSDVARPYVAAFEDADGDNFLPTRLDLLDGTLGAARTTDAITITPAQVAAALMVAGGNPVTAGANLSGAITGGSSLVRVG